VNTERKRVAMRPGDTTPFLDLLREHVTNLRIEILDGVGHFSQLEAPERLNRLIGGFLEAV
jgi:pimeloyl-ACP methyl ester carboxylesterase